jgi:hypothetical protein
VGQPTPPESPAGVPGHKPTPPPGPDEPLEPWKPPEPREDDEPAEEDRAPAPGYGEGGVTLPCPNCGARVRDDALECPRCETPLTPGGG